LASNLSTLVYVSKEIEKKFDKEELEKYVLSIAQAGSILEARILKRTLEELINLEINNKEFENAIRNGLEKINKHYSNTNESMIIEYKRDPELEGYVGIAVRCFENLSTIGWKRYF
ncbi:MAG: hypothetical protein QW051_03145, partial [Candidatus Aenigmatarchaeota archaeon]